ncbi:hypothetical protein V6O07_11790, partial [Arthrospira platensis SPKY2]
MANDQATLTTNLQNLKRKEIQEARLKNEKQELEEKLAGLKNLELIRRQVNELTIEVQSLELQEQDCKLNYDHEVNNPFNYLCHIQTTYNGWFWHYDYSGSFPTIRMYSSASGTGSRWKFARADQGYYTIQTTYNGWFC